MRNKILTLCVAVAAFAGLLPAGASAHEAAASAPVQTAVTTLPETARVNATALVDHRYPHRRHYYRHRHYRHYRRGYYYHGGRYYRRHYYRGRPFYYRGGLRIFIG